MYAIRSYYEFCLGFEVHQPFRLNKEFVYGQEDGKDDHSRRYFDPANKEILLRVCDKCYEPATSLRITSYNVCYTKLLRPYVCLCSLVPHAVTVCDDMGGPRE